jgi:betaine lipid synthase
MNKAFPLKNFKAIYLVDLSPSLCEVARKRFAQHKWTNVHVECVDANEFKLPDGTKADLVTMSYSLSMIPTYYSLVDKISKILGKEGVVAVVDFYVQSSASLSGRATSVGGEVLRHVNWLSRNFWRVWFEFDRVYLDPARRDYLEYRFGTIKSLNFRNTSLGSIPYYIWVGCDKHHALDIEYRHALATESPYLAPTDLQDKSDINSLQNQIILRSKGYEASIINMVRNMPYPSFYYQHEVWRIFYNTEHPQHHQFNNQYIYAFTWEDPDEDIRLLGLGPEDVVLAITSAGDNIIAYAAMNNPPKRIHGVDLNPAQNHLMELKLAALRALPHEEVWHMFGEGKHGDFLDTLYNKLSKHMSSHALQYWARTGPKAFDPKGKGLYDTGSSRWALRLARWVFTVFGVQEHVVRLCNAKTMKEQAEIWQQNIRPALFNPIVCKLLVGNPVFLWKALGVPINQASLIEGGIIQYVIDTIEPLIYKYQISSENYFYYLCLMGQYSRSNCPAYLTKKGHFNLAKRKDALDGIRLHTDTINDVVDRLAPGSVTCAIIMDHMDWFSPTGTDALDEIVALNKCLSKGGRVMLRSSSKKPWYLDTFEAQGFKTKAAAVRYSGKAIDRVNMYASTWICTKVYDCNENSDVNTLQI